MVNSTISKSIVDGYPTLDNYNDLDFKIEGTVLVKCTKNRGSVQIPYGVTKIGICAFAGCNSINQIIIPDSVTEIGSSAFYECSNLTNIIIPSSVIEIGGYSLASCSKLYNITMPAIFDDFESIVGMGSECRNITITGGEIKYKAFYNNKKLRSVTINDNVTTIGNSAFENCSELQDVVFSQSIIRIGSNAFDGCMQLKKINIFLSEKYENKRVSYMCSISPSTFKHGMQITDWYNLTFQFDVKNISYDGIQFNLCGNFLEIVKYNNEYQKEIIIPDYLKIQGTLFEVNRIQNRVFENYRYITMVEIPSTISNLGEYVFRGCSNLNKIYYNGNVSQWCRIKSTFGFQYLMGEGRDLLINKKIVSGQLIIPKDVYKIPDCAFMGCRYIRSVVIPANVKEIGFKAFSGCNHMKYIKIPDSIEYLNCYAFDKEGMAITNDEIRDETGATINDALLPLIKYDGTKKQFKKLYKNVKKEYKSLIKTWNIKCSDGLIKRKGK